MSLHCTAAVGFRVVVPMSTLTPTNCSLPLHLFKISPPIHQILLPTNKNGNGFFGTRPNSLSTGIPIPIHPRLIITTACRKTTDSDMANQSFQESDQLLSEKKKTTFEIVSITQEEENNDDNSNSALNVLLDWGLLISPFFFWGTAMVAMKEVLPKTGPFFIATFRLIPAGLLLVAFAASRGRKLPSGTMPWLSITLFALVDATCFQGFLAQGLQTTSAGLGSVIIDSQPLTVAVLAALLFGELIGVVGVSGLVLGVVGLVLLESDSYFSSSSSSLWGSGEWWMLLAAQSMAVGTVMVRWVSKYSDPIMATGWHMVIGGVPLLVISVLNHDPAIGGNLTSADILALVYTSIFGSAISYGVYFYNATRGSLTKLSSLTFLTPMFASVFGYFFLEETFTPVQLLGAFITLVSIYLVNYKTSSTEIESEL